jgi:hypothetical protein
MYYDCFTHSLRDLGMQRLGSDNLHSSRYPDIVYLNFVWTESDRARFAQDTQRARYLKCNALINPLPEGTPLYAVQYISYSSCPTYTTTRNSFVIFATTVPAPTYYLCTTKQLEVILKPWNKRWPAEGPEPEARLNQPPQMWKKNQTGAVPPELRQLDPYKVASAQMIYNEITRRCIPLLGEIPPTFTARELRDIIPRPQSPEDGVRLGSRAATLQSAASVIAHSSEA